MVRIIIRGKSQMVPKEESREIFSFFATKLLGKRLSKNVSVYVTFNPKLFKEEQSYGYVMPIGAARYPRKFSVKIDAQLNSYMTILTIAHEMTHVKHYCRGELRDIKGYPKKWLGEIYDESVEYKDLPWEKDALKMEQILYQAWIEYKGSNNGKGTFD